jgi:hypothetical protein
MRIGLVDVDGHNFPNLALMKLATYHKQRGDEVEWAFPLLPYDRVYMAKVFTFTQDDITAYQTDDIVRGGTGYDLQSKLPADVEKCYPNYSIYGITDTAYGYLTRGCPRGCKFCIVATKEGCQSKKVASLENFWRGQKYIKLLDPNLLACPDWKELMQQLIDSKAWVDFTQGLDIRLMTAEKADMIQQCKKKMLHFAWDNPEDELTFEKLKEYRKAFSLPDDKCKVYVLTNFNSTHEQDLERVYRLRDIGYDPFVMVYEKWNAPKETRRLQRWCNNKVIFRAEPDFAKYH